MVLVFSLWRIGFDNNYTERLCHSALSVHEHSRAHSKCVCFCLPIHDLCVTEMDIININVNMKIYNFPLAQFFFHKLYKFVVKVAVSLPLCLRCFSLLLSELKKKVRGKSQPSRSRIAYDPDTRPNIEGKHIDLERNVALLFALSFRNHYRSSIIWQKLFIIIYRLFCCKMMMDGECGRFVFHTPLCLFT